MKTTLLLCVAVMFTALYSAAQNLTAAKPSTNIPFSKKMPLPGTPTYQGKALPQNYRPGINTNVAGGQKINSFSANAIKKDPEYYRQLLQKNRNSMRESLRKSNSSAIPLSNSNDADADFHFTKDINALAESFPSSNAYNNVKPTYAILDGVIYFAADDGVHGSELWRSDGTQGGTYMVKDIEPGLASSGPINITALNGKVYFAAYTISYGLEPWVSDGTEGNTQLLMDIRSGDITDSYPSFFTAYGNKVYFVSDGESVFWSQLWKTDGTTEGTKLVKDLGNDGYYISQPTAANGLLFFTFLSFNTGYWQLWRSDGSNGGTYAVGPQASFVYVPAQLTKYGKQLYFSSDEGAGRKLWVSDGTDAGTKPAPGNHNILVDADYFGITFPIYGKALYLPGISETKGSGLYRYDASDNQGLVKVKDITHGTEPYYIVPSEMVVVKNMLYFKVTDFGRYPHDELWISDGCYATTKPLQKFLSYEFISTLTDGGNILYFVKYYDKWYGSELWESDGIHAGAVMVTDVFKGPTSSFPAFLTPFKGGLYFGATDEKKGNELFWTTGTNASTVLVKDINAVATSSSYAGLFGIAAIGNSVLTPAYENVHNFELYKSDGTAAGTDLLNSIAPGENGSYPFNFISKNDAVYFIASPGINYAIYKSDGTKTGLQRITPLYDANFYYITGYTVADNGLLFYVVYDFNTSTYNLWRTDGTAAGTFLLNSTVYSSNYLNAAGNTAFFVAGDPVHGNELWKSDGTVAGTEMVKDINSGINDAVPGGMFLYNGEVYFGAFDGVNHGFWKSDGTPDGTIMLKNIDPWWNYDVASTGYFFCISNDILFFSAINYNNNSGTVLWKTDGTPAGTQRVKDINPTNGDYVPGPYYLTDVNGTLFFTADDGIHGTELWKSDGTREGTKMVKDITSGIDPSYIYGLSSFDGKLYFATFSFADEAYHLWSSDGSGPGTKPVSDAVIGSVNIQNIFAAGNHLFISGYTQAYGIELYAGDASNMFAAVSNQPAMQAIESFNALLYPNPSSSKAVLQLTGNVKNVTVSVTDMNGKKLWQSNNTNAAIITLPVEKFAKGTYIITVSNGKQTRDLKLVKQ